MPRNYPIWNADDKIPNTNVHALPSRTLSVTNVLAIRVRSATYRSCQPINGVFELVSDVPQSVANEERFEVYCAWFGVKPRNRYPRISVGGNYEIIQNYTGDVIDNISVESPINPLQVSDDRAERHTDDESRNVFEQNLAKELHQLALDLYKKNGIKPSKEEIYEKYKVNTGHKLSQEIRDELERS